MIRGSSWKGALAASARKLVRENKEYFPQFARIWGLGSCEYRQLIDSLKEDNREEIRKAAIYFALFELGLSLDKNDISVIKNDPLEFLKNLSQNLTITNVKNKTLFPFLQPHKGRAIFYPTFFDKVSYEIINPHDRKRRAGINPIYYEIVPEGARGKLQIIYIPHDAVLSESQILKDQVKEDISFLCRAIEKTEEEGIGAKIKLGWGRFELMDKKYFITDKDFSVEGWYKC
ncbi:MAG: hypothetical protein GX066_00265 [Clostridiaceae bacterium]|nr:hypothetical protein [Clostridiaceae bacterium]